MPDIPRPTESIPAAQPLLPPTAGLDRTHDRTATETALLPEAPPVPDRVGWG